MPDFDALFAPATSAVSKAAPDFATLFAPDNEPDWRDKEAEETARALGIKLPQPSSNVVRGNILPLQRNLNTGKVSPAVPQSVEDAFTLPGDVYAGRADLNTPEGQERAFNFSMFAAPAAPRGAAIPRRAAPRVPARTAEELKATGGQRMKESKLSEAEMPWEDTVSPVANLKARLESEAIDMKGATPKAQNLLRRLEALHTQQAPGPESKGFTNVVPPPAQARFS